MNIKQTIRQAAVGLVAVMFMIGCGSAQKTRTALAAAPPEKKEPIVLFRRANGQACTEQNWNKEFARKDKADCTPVSLAAKCSALEYKRMGDMTPADLRVLEECKQLSPEAQAVIERLARSWMQNIACPFERENETRNPELVHPKVLAACRERGF